MRTTVLAWLTLLIAACAPPGALAAPAPAALRVDPPSWWIGFENPELQLLVHGRRIAELAPALSYPGVRLAAETRAENPNYLFLTLHIDAGAAPGRVPITFRRGNRVVAHYEYPLEARRQGSRERQGFDSRDAIYLAVPDRFANGDPGNDHPPGTLDRLDRTRPGARHGGDLAGVKAHLDYLERLGFTQLWLTPVFENAQPEYSYHGYAITDHYRIDPRLGSNADYRALAAAARARGIGLIADVVVNHIGSKHWWMADLPSSDWINGDVSQPWTNHLHSSVPDPYAASVDRERFVRGWFDSMMPDLNDTNPLLANYLIQSALWWIEYADLSGLRVDTYPYSDQRFMAAFTRRVMTEYPNFNIVGEETTADPALLAYWQAGTVNRDGYVSHLPSLLDFPLQSALVEAFAAAGRDAERFKGLYARLADDFIYPRPQNLVLFADNHDTERIYTLLHDDAELVRMALAFVATAPRIPQLFYGTEILMENRQPKDDGDVRRDFPGGWPGDAVDAFSGRGLAAAPAAMQQFVQKLFSWRKGSKAVHTGGLTHYAPADGVYVWFRYLGDETVMLALNFRREPARLELARFRERLAKGAVGRDVESGARVELGEQLTLPARSTTIIDIGGATAAASAGRPGRLVSYGSFPSREVPPRKVTVWLPPGYDAGSQRYAVLYMQDGQNLFDPATAMKHEPWAVDQKLAALMRAGAVRDTLLVGIASTPERWREYAPLAAVEALAPELRATVTGAGGGPPTSEQYLKFLVGELKPFIDAHYRTRPGRADTFVMGSSMGGLISLYALSRYPQVFGGAGCLSTHWPLTNAAGLLEPASAARLEALGAGSLEWLKQALPPAGAHRLYFDHGTVGLDALYGPLQLQVDALVVAKGYRPQVDVLSRVYEGASHDEPAWRERVDVPLGFLLRP